MESVYFRPIDENINKISHLFLQADLALPQFSPQELQWIMEMKKASLVAEHLIYTNDFNLLRWAQAYKGNIHLAAKKYRRHLRIREILQLDFVENLDDGIDDDADKYAPIIFLGEVIKFF